VSERLRKAVSLALEAGYQLDKEAFSLLEELPEAEDPAALIEKAVRKAGTLAEKPLFISRKFLKELLAEEFQQEPHPSKAPSITTKRVFKPYAKEFDSDIKVVENPTDEICTTGSVEDYLKYFRNRFKRLEKILRRRMDVKDAMPVSEALKAPKNSKVKVIGMLTEKRESKQRTFIRLEDMNAAVTVFVPQSIEKTAQAKVQALLLDHVVCINAVKSRNDLLILEDVIFPDVPKRKPRKAPIPVYAALISDLHVGSKLFMEEVFNRFVLWLNGKLGNASQRELAGKIKYVIVAGDIVDGIGVYPGQVKELAVKDIYQQYNTASKFVGEIPEHIELIVTPGNHDASRKALPQPAIPKEYAESLYEAREIHSLGDPCIISLHGVELLVYHGRSLDDVIATAPNQDFKDPGKAMRLLLQCRHLAPIYGQKTLISPENKDFMVIERIPDIFHTGHIHVEKHDFYKGILLVNSGAWQKQTIFQKKMGLQPTPGIVPIVNLQTLEVVTMDFNQLI